MTHIEGSLETWYVCFTAIIKRLDSITCIRPASMPFANCIEGKLNGLARSKLVVNSPFLVDVWALPFSPICRPLHRDHIASRTAR